MNQAAVCAPADHHILTGYGPASLRACSYSGVEIAQLKTLMLRQRISAKGR